MNSHSSTAAPTSGVWGAWPPALAVVFTIVGAAWGLAWSLGGNFARLEAAIERVQAAVESNREAIDRNREAIDRNREAIEANRAAIGENSATMASIAGQLAEHLRRHDREADD